MSDGTTRPTDVLTAICVSLNATHDRDLQAGANLDWSERLSRALSDTLVVTRGRAAASVVLAVDSAALSPGEVRDAVERFFDLRSRDGSPRRHIDAATHAWLTRLVDAVVFMAIHHGDSRRKNL